MKLLHSILGSFAMLSAVYGGDVVDRIKSFTPLHLPIASANRFNIQKQPFSFTKNSNYLQPFTPYTKLDFEPKQHLYVHRIFPDITVYVLDPPIAVSAVSPKTPSMTTVFIGQTFRLIDADSNEVFDELDSIVIERPGSAMQIYGPGDVRGTELFNGVYNLIRNDVDLPERDEKGNLRNTIDSQKKDKDAGSRIPIAYFRPASKAALSFFN